MRASSTPSPHRASHELERFLQALDAAGVRVLAVLPPQAVSAGRGERG